MIPTKKSVAVDVPFRTGMKHAIPIWRDTFISAIRSHCSAPNGSQIGTLERNTLVWAVDGEVEVLPGPSDYTEYVRVISPLGVGWVFVGHLTAT